MWNLFVIRFHYGTFSRILQFITSHTFSQLQKSSRTVSHRLAPHNSHLTFFRFSHLKRLTQPIEQSLTHSFILHRLTPSHSIYSHGLSADTFHYVIQNAIAVKAFYLFICFFLSFLIFSLSHFGLYLRSSDKNTKPWWLMEVVRITAYILDFWHIHSGRSVKKTTKPSSSWYVFYCASTFSKNEERIFFKSYLNALYQTKTQIILYRLESNKIRSKRITVYS